jgi:protein SCO1/2
MSGTGLKSRELTALGALAAILVITGVWWALALWPLPGDAPGWLVRTRAVCFGSVSNGLPTISGWMALIGQPLYMLTTLWLIWGEVVGSGLRTLAGSRAGRGLLRSSALVLVAALVAAGVRVADAATNPPAGADIPALAAADVPRLDRAAPPLALGDQNGRPVTLAQFRGRPVLLTFAFAHCETVCPLIVHDVLGAQAGLWELDPVVLVVTLDPWRDTPARLPAMAAQWGFGAHAFALSGPVADVERTLDAWNVGRDRNPRTGEVTHATLLYVIDRDGRIAFAVAGGAGAATIAELAHRL